MNSLRSFLLCLSLLSQPVLAETTTKTTHHTISINGQNLEYEAITADIEINDREKQPQASIFYTAYFKKEENKNAPPRPLTFCFNGGPGSSSVWLHMGFLGPKRVILTDCTPTPPPSSYENNPYTLLDKTDLVFVDPVSTGFSATAPKIDSKQFHGVEEDIESLSEFIRHFLTQYQRWNSPLFLLGESYGTMRVVGLAEKLKEPLFIDLNGIILISPCLDFQFYDQENPNSLSNALFLPSFTATAWYHKKLKPELQKKPLKILLEEVQLFALQEYAPAILLGNRLEQQKKETLLTRLSQYTGLTEQYLKDNSLRVTNQQFFKELLKTDSKVIGRFDSRCSGFYQTSTRDPSFDAVTGPFTSAFQQYLCKELATCRTEPYKVLNGEDVFPWNFSYQNLHAGLGYVRLSPTLGKLLVKTPSLGVFVASGYYDLATPYFAAQQSIASINANQALLQNITMNCYEAGHMMYLHEPSLAKIRADIGNFIEKNCRAGQSGN